MCVFDKVMKIFFVILVAFMIGGLPFLAIILEKPDPYTTDYNKTIKTLTITIEQPIDKIIIDGKPCKIIDLREEE